MRKASAADLTVGDVLVTSIGRAPVKTITPKAGGLEIVLDVNAQESTRAASQGSVLHFWRHDAVRVDGRAQPSRVPLPASGDRASGGRGGRVLFQKRPAATEQEIPPGSDGGER